MNGLVLHSVGKCDLYNKSTGKNTLEGGHLGFLTGENLKFMN